MKKQFIIFIMLCCSLLCMLLGCNEEVDYRSWTDEEMQTSVPFYMEHRDSRIVILDVDDDYIIPTCFNFDKTIKTPVEAEAMAKEAFAKLITMTNGVYQDEELRSIQYYTVDNTWVFAFGPPGVWCGSPAYVAVAGEDGSFMNAWYEE